MLGAAVVAAAGLWFALRTSDRTDSGGAGAGPPEAAAPEAGGAGTGAESASPTGTPGGPADVGPSSRTGGGDGTLPAPAGPPAGSPDPSGADGRYTIFIASYISPADAETLAGRWERAGYPAFVQEAGKWHRVGLGRYATVSAARAEAESLRQAFEQGYWIGPAGP